MISFLLRRTTTSLLCCLLLYSFAFAQNARNHIKPVTAYRQAYQRVAGSKSHFHAFEIRGGTLWAWGYGGYGQLGDGVQGSYYSPIQIGNDTKWATISCGYNHTLALKSDGTLWASGQNNNSQLGDGTANGIQTTFEQIGSDNKWTSINAGYNHSTALKSDGTLWAWGLNSYGQLGDGSTTTASTPEQIGTDKKWMSIATGQYHTVALKSDGTLWAWGRNNNGQLGDGTTTDKNTPVQIGTDNKWISVTCGNLHTVALKSDGTLWAWGINSSGQLGDGSYTQRNAPVQIGTDTRWTQICCGASHTLALKSDGTLWAWGSNPYGGVGNGTSNNYYNTPQQVGTDNKWVSISTTQFSSYGVKADGGLWAWGWNSNGQLGDGSTSNQSSPEQIRKGNRDWLQVANGYTHSIAIKGDGTLWAWGSDANGELGDNDSLLASKGVPVQVGTDNKWVNVVAGAGHNLALKSDGTLWAWGQNNYNQLGDGTGNNALVPEQIGSDNKWVSIAAGPYHSLAVKSNGTLWAWGYNAYGELGDGSSNSSNMPVQIGSDNKWVSVAAGDYHSLALKSDGTLWSWGYNGFGELGDGTTTSTDVPAQIGTNNKWVSISAGQLYSAALRNDGTLWTWGYNGYGELGDGTTTDAASPQQVGLDTGWISLVTGAAHTLALKSDGSLWTWGFNSHGELGDGTNTAKSSPQQISSQSNVVYIGVGGYTLHSMLIRSTRDHICASGQNGGGVLADGTIADNNNFNCSNNVCRAYSLTPSPVDSVSAQPLTGTGNRTDLQGSCAVVASVQPSGSAPVSGNLSAIVVNDASVQLFNGKAYVQRHYDLLPATNPNTATASVTLYFTQGEFNAYNAANGSDLDLPTGPNDASGIANLRITQYHGIPTGGYAPSNYPSTWSGAGPAHVMLTPSSVLWNADDSRWEVTISVTGFSGFFAHGNINNSPLPIRLDGFTATVQNMNDVLLNWQTNSLQPDELYTVERSQDGAVFTAIGFKNSTGASDYSLHDNQPLNGRSYYRLRVTGSDGKASYSEVRTVFINGGQDYVNVYPSPAHEYFVIESNAPASAVLSDMSGKELIHVSSVTSGVKIPIAHLPAGVYLLKMDNGRRFKVVKE